MEHIKVLHIDDEPAVLEQSKVFLEKEDERLDVETTTSPKKALEKMEEEDYDAIIADYQMPEMDGIELLKIIREEKNDEIPFLIFTGRGREEVALEALNLGANRYLRKGADPKSQYGILSNAIVQEIKLQRFEKRKDFFKLSATHAPEAIFVSNEDADIVYANEQAARKLNYSIEELEEKKIFEIDPNFSKENWDEHWREVEEKGKIEIESKHVKEDGSSFPVELLINKVEHQGTDYHFTFARDISEYKQIERELEIGKARVQMMAENSGVHMCRIDNDFKFRYVNKKTLSLLEKPENEVLDEKIQKFFNEQELEPFINALKRVFETSEGEELRHEMKGSTFRSFLSPIPNPNTGEVEFILISSKDISERIKAEEREEFLQSLLRHDLKNKLNVAKAYLEKIREDGFTEKSKDYLDLAIDVHESGIGQIEKVRTLRRIGEEKPEPVDIGPMLERVVEEKEDLASKNGIELDYSICSCRALGGALLEDLFNNLIENSIEHSGCDKIEIRCWEGDEKCKICIADDGKGIADDEKSKVFEKGYKEGKDSGSGLGLFLVHRIIEQYNGHIKLVDSESGGTKFKIQLKKPDGESSR